MPARTIRRFVAERQNDGSRGPSSPRIAFPTGGMRRVATLDAFDSRRWIRIVDLRLVKFRSWRLRSSRKKYTSSVATRRVRMGIHDPWAGRPTATLILSLRDAGKVVCGAEDGRTIGMTPSSRA